VIPFMIPIHFFCPFYHKLGFGTLVIYFVVCSNQCLGYIAIFQICFSIVVTKLQNFHSFIEEIDKLYKCKDQHSSFKFFIISKLCKKSKVSPQQLVFST
jgi:hypothetical protein